MGKHQVDASGMDVERLAEVTLAHRRAFDVPAWPAAAERRIPGRAELLVWRQRPLPESKVADRFLVVLVLSNAGGRASPLRHASTRLETAAVEVRQSPVRRKACDPKVDVAVGDVRVLVLDELGDHLDHLGDMLGRAGIV